MNSLLALALVLSAFSTPNAVSTPASSVETSAPASAQVAKDADKSRIRCKTFRPSGTRFDKRVCKTLSDWDREREEAREAAKEIQNKPQICVGDCAGG